MLLPAYFHKRSTAHVWSLGSKVQAQQNTTVTNNISADGYSWANSRPLTIDKYGNRLAIAQRYNGGTKYHTFVYANSTSGAWTDSTLNEGFLVRGTVAYDSVNDFVHVLWMTTQANGGIIYRRYVFTRDGSNNITDIQSDSTVGTRTNLVMDDQSGLEYEHPVMLWLNDAAYGTYGALVAIYAAQSGTGNEIRASMCNLGATATRGQTAGNWAAVVSADTTGIGGGAPPVVFSKLYSSANTGYPYLGINRKTAGTNAKDLYLVYHTGVNPGAFQFRRARWNSGANDWSTGLTTAAAISNVQRSGTDTGYSLKTQLISRPVESVAGDCVYVGFATWKSNASGDTWGFAKIDNADAVTLVDTYSAAGVHSLYPTGDIAYASAKGLLVATYIKTSTGYTYAQLYADTATQGSEVLAFDGATTDIPCIETSADFGGKVAILLRDAINSPVEPYHGWYATLTWT